MRKRTTLAVLYACYAAALGLTGSFEGAVAGLVVLAVGVALYHSTSPELRPFG